MVILIRVTLKVTITAVHTHRLIMIFKLKPQFTLLHINLAAKKTDDVAGAQHGCIVTTDVQQTSSFLSSYSCLNTIPNKF